MTPLGVVFLFMLVNWWVEKHQRFYSTFTNVIFYFCHVFYVFNVFFIFFLERFYIYVTHRCPLTRWPHSADLVINLGRSAYTVVTMSSNGRSA